MIIPVYILHHPHFSLENYLNFFKEPQENILRQKKEWMYTTSFNKSKGIITLSHPNFSSPPSGDKYGVHPQPKKRYGVDIIE